MNRQAALNIIRTEIAKHGEVTKKAMQVYIENKISSESFKKAFNDGLEIFNNNRTSED